MRLRNIPGAKETIESSPFVIQNPEEAKGKWKEIFGNDNPIHIEVGMGKGRFLTDMARLYPEVNYVGIELYDSVLLRGIQKREELEAAGEPFPNLYFICADARLLPGIFAKEEVARVYLNFSDPWPKARHSKRRLTSRQFLERYSKILPIGGIVEFKTDNKDLFDFSLEVVGEVKDWTLDGYTYDLHQDNTMNQGNVMTEYEEKFSSMGNPIYKLVAHLSPEV